jgi:hypothetical protein
MSFFDLTNFVFWNEGGAYVFYAQSPVPGDHLRWIDTSIARVPFTYHPTRPPAPPEPAMGIDAIRNGVGSHLIRT